MTKFIGGGFEQLNNRSEQWRNVALDYSPCVLLVLVFQYVEKLILFELKLDASESCKSFD